MKNIIKLTALILSLLTLFGCAEKPLQSSGESSVTNSEVSSTDSVSSLDSEATESTESVDENWIKGKENCETFSFDKNSFSFTNSYYETDKTYDSHGFSPYDGATLEKYISKKETGIFIKGRIAGESYNAFYTGYNQLFFDNSDAANKSGKTVGNRISYPPCYHIVLTPVVVEEIIDDRTYGTSLKVGDIVYVTENYYIVSNNAIKVIEAKKNYTLNSLALPEKEELTQNTERRYNEEIDLHNQLLSGHSDKVAMGEILYPMEKDKSYLLFVTEKHDYKEIDEENVKICKTYLNFNLSDDAPPFNPCSVMDSYEILASCVTPYDKSNLFKKWSEMP